MPAQKSRTQTAGACPAGRAAAGARRSRRAAEHEHQPRLPDGREDERADRARRSRRREAISPNVRAPSSSVSFATSGSSTSKLNENVLTRRTVKNVTATRRELTANRSASTTTRGCRERPGARRAWGELIARRQQITIA
jgi:hypothetical protein